MYGNHVEPNRKLSTVNAFASCVVSCLLQATRLTILAPRPVLLNSSNMTWLVEFAKPFQSDHPAGLINFPSEELMKATFAYTCQGRPKNAGNIEMFACTSSGVASTVHERKTSPAFFCMALFRMPLAVKVMFWWPVIVAATRASRVQFWKTAAAFPKMKSTVPYIVQLV